MAPWPSRPFVVFNRVELLAESMMRLLHAKRWLELSRQAVCESDPKKLSSILKQMNDLLKGKNVRRRNPQENG
jgi:hypothetical protein